MEVYNKPGDQGVGDIVWGEYRVQRVNTVTVWLFELAQELCPMRDIFQVHKKHFDIGPFTSLCYFAYSSHPFSPSSCPLSPTFP